MRKYISAIFGLAVFFAPAASATTLSMFGDLADTQIRKDGLINGDPQQPGGQSGFNAFDYSMVFVFPLPALAPNQFISDADFSFFVTSSSSIFNTDLYGLAHRTTPEVLASDWYSGPGDPNNTLIQGGILTPSFTFSGRTSTSAAGDVGLKNFLNAQHASGAVGGEYIFLRLSASALAKPNLNVNFYYTSDEAFLVAGIVGMDQLPRFQELHSPKLVVTIDERLNETAVPEPESAGGVLVGLGALFAVRRLRARDC